MVNHIELALMQDDELSRASSSSSAAGVVQQSGQQGCGGTAIGGNEFVALEDRPTNASYSSRRGTPGNKNVGVGVEEYEKASSCTDCCSGSEWSNDGDHGASYHGDLKENNINNDNANEKTRVMTESDEKNPWSKEYFGIPVNYFSVGVIFGGSVSVLYPLLVIQHGVTASFYAASASLVTLFWSYKILFGLCCDVFPIRGQKWKPYIILGWAVCACMLVILASLGEDVSPVHLVIMLTFANLGYVAADVAADGMMVWMAHHETTARRGKIQSLIYIFRNFGRIFINLVIIFAFSGPAVNCPGYEKDRDVPCTTDESVVIRNDLADELPDTWCYQQCDGAQFAFGLTIPQFAWLIAAVNLVSIPSYFMLKEEKKPKESISQVASNFWTVMKKRPVWQGKDKSESKEIKHASKEKKRTSQPYSQHTLCFLVSVMLYKMVSIARFGRSLLLQYFTSKHSCDLMHSSHTLFC
jgi:MFS family permease